MTLLTSPATWTTEPAPGRSTAAAGANQRPEADREEIAKIANLAASGALYPNIVPGDGLRLPDALTIKYGPAPLIARFVLEGDKYGRQIGIRFRLRHDFDELLYVNKQQASRGTWFPLMQMFDPRYCDLIPENSYWISGEDEHGEVAVTQAGRIYYWPDTTLETEARLMFYGGHDRGQLCHVTAAAAKDITGVVLCGGSHWIRPDFRGRRLSRLVGRLGRAVAVARWPVDWAMALVTTTLLAKGVALGYGYKHPSRSIFYPGSPLGDLEAVLVYLSAAEAYEDFAEFLAAELIGTDEFAALSALGRSPRDHSVTKISSDGVFHGRSSLS